MRHLLCGLLLFCGLLPLHAQSRGDREAAWQLVQQGRGLAQRGLYRQALPSFEEATTLFRRTQDKVGLSVSLGGLGIVHRNLGDYESALRCHQEALGIDSELGRLDFLAADYAALGLINHSLLRWEEAISFHRKSLEISRQLGDTRGQASSYDDIGNALLRMGNLKEALDHYQRAWNLYAKVLDLHGLAIASANIGNVYYMLGDFEAALEHYGGMYALSVRAGDVHMEAKAHESIGNAYLSMGELEEARASLQSAAALLSRAEDSASSSILLGRLLDLEMEAGNLSEARDIAEQIGDPFYLGRVNYLLGKHSVATAYFSRAIAALTEAGPLSDLLPALVGRGLSQEAAGEFQKAYEDFSRATSLLESVRAAGPEAPSLLAPRTQGFSRVEPYEGLARIASKPEEAFHWSEHTKARSFLEGVGGDPRPLRADQIDLAADEVLIEYEVTGKQTLVFVVKGSKVVDFDRIDVHREDLARMVEDYRRPFEAAAESRSTRSLREFDLDLGHRLFRLLLARPLRYAGSSHIVIVPDEALCLLPFEALIESRPSPAVWIDGERGPFPAGVRYVGDKRVLRYSQSASALTVSRRTDSSPHGRRVLIVADPTYESHEASKDEEPDPRSLLGMKLRAAARALSWRRFRQLPETRKFAERMAQEFERDLTTLTGLDATETRVLSEAKEDYGLGVVFATHGIIDDRVPYLKQAALVLTDPWISHEDVTSDRHRQQRGIDGFLTASEIMDMRIPTELAAALACRTGEGRLIPGEGVMNLARAFQHAGARSVLVSLWSVEGDSTNIFAERFLTGLRDGEDKDEALLTARSLLRRRGYEHPFYWAPFILFGERNSVLPGPTIARAPGMRWAALILGAIVLAAGLRTVLRARTRI